MAEWLFGELRWKGNNFTPLTDTSRHDPIPNVDQGNDKLQPHKGGAVPVSPGYKFNDPALPPGWGNRAGTTLEPVDDKTTPNGRQDGGGGYDAEPVSYGPHNSLLTDAQARALHLMWLVTGQDASAVGSGQVRSLRDTSTRSWPGGRVDPTPGYNPHGPQNNPDDIVPPGVRDAATGKSPLKAPGGGAVEE